MPQKPSILLVHYNPNSTGSFAERSVALISRLSESYLVHIWIPKRYEARGEAAKTELSDSEASFRDRVSEIPGVLIYDRALEEPGSLIAYLQAFIGAAKFVFSKRISLVYYLDWVWWKPAETLAFKLLGKKQLTFVGFYKDKEALSGFIRLLQLFIVNSASTAEAFVGQGWKERVRVVHNFLELKPYDDAPLVREELFPKLGSRKLIGFVGALHPIKGIECMLEALAKVFGEREDCCAVIVGAEKIDSYSDSLQRKARQLHIESRVRFIGHRDDIPAVMKSLDFLVVPSLSEPFGYVNIEAGAAGKPVIASRVGGIPEIVIDSETGLLVEADNRLELAEACRKLLENSDLREDLGLAARKRIENFFSMRHGLQRFEKIFERQLNGTKI